MAASLTIAPPSWRTLRPRNAGVYPEDAIAAYIDGRRPVEPEADAWHDDDRVILIDGAHAATDVDGVTR